MHETSEFKQMQRPIDTWEDYCYGRHKDVLSKACYARLYSNSRFKKREPLKALGSHQVGVRGGVGGGES